MIPEKPGYYWVKVNDEFEIIYVSGLSRSGDDELYVRLIDGYHKLSNYSDWVGPLEPPKEEG